MNVEGEPKREGRLGVEEVNDLSPLTDIRTVRQGLQKLITEERVSSEELRQFLEEKQKEYSEMPAFARNASDLRRIIEWLDGGENREEQIIQIVRAREAEEKEEKKSSRFWRRFIKRTP